MSHCHDEHSHSHSHSHSHEHDHTDDLTPALQNHLYTHIDFDHITTLNESTPDAGTSIVRKPWTSRLDPTPSLTSDADAQLLMHIPFTGQIRLHSILLRTSTTASAPQTLKVFVNRDGLDFGTAEQEEPAQTLECAQSNEVQEIPVKRAKFNTVRSLGLFFEDNWSAGEEDETRVDYLGFKGEWLKVGREPVSFLYELAANPKDHVLPAGVGERVGRGIGGAGGGGGNGM